MRMTDVVPNFLAIGELGDSIGMGVEEDGQR
jgi:hypothetical protein